MVVTACGRTFTLTRQEAKETSWLTIWRGKQTCSHCPDYLEALPPAAIAWVLVQEVIPGGLTDFLQSRNHVQSADDAEAS